MVVVSLSEIQFHKRYAAEHMVNSDLLAKGARFAEAFIKERELVIYGGLATHYYLLSQGSGLYEDYDAPDYDVLSDDNVNLAYAAAEKLNAMSLPNVNVIRAIHPQTMRVRIGTVVVLDLSYCPPTIFASLPVEVYRGMRYVGPRFQLIDMHTVFMFPLRGAPREDVKYRWPKMQSRMNSLLLKPLTPEHAEPENIALHDVAIPNLPDLPHIAHGFYGLAILHEIYGRLQQRLGLPKVEGCRLAITETHFKCPVAYGSVADVFVDNVSHKQKVQALAKHTYSALTGARGQVAVTDEGTRLWLLNGDQIIAHQLESQEAMMPNVNSVLYFLLVTPLEKPELLKECMTLYNQLIAMTRHVNQALKQADATIEAITSTPFALTLNTFGKAKPTWSSSYVLMLHSFEDRATNQTANPPFLPPKNYFLGEKKDRITATYDYSDGAYFFTNGDPITSSK